MHRGLHSDAGMDTGMWRGVSAAMQPRRTMKFRNTTKVLAKRIRRYYRVSNCVAPVGPAVLMEVHQGKDDLLLTHRNVTIMAFGDEPCHQFSQHLQRASCARPQRLTWKKYRASSSSMT